MSLLRGLWSLRSYALVVKSKAMALLFTRFYVFLLSIIDFLYRYNFSYEEFDSCQNNEVFVVCCSVC